MADPLARSGAQRPPASVAAFLSFLWPGLGELSVGRRQRALVFALPVLVIAGAIAWQARGGLDLLAVQLIDPRVAGAVLALVVAVGLWRIVSVVGAWRLAGGTWQGGPGSRTALVALVAAVVGMHGLGAWYAYAFYDSGSKIFVSSEPRDLFGDSSSPGTTTSPGTATSPGATSSPAIPEVTPGPTARVSILLSGLDSGHDRDHALTDTLLVVSFDPVAKTAVMLSMPRDVSNFPLYSGGTFSSKINSLMTYARLDPSRFPDGPTRTLTRELGFLLGIRIDYVAVINLEGFERMVNLVGGVDVVNPRQISDPSYDWFDGTHGFYLSAGPHHLDGRIGLAYARSREGIGDNDFTRAARQQQIIVALRAKMTQPAMLANLPAILDAATQVIRTDFPADRVGDLLALGKQIPDSSIQRFVLGPPYSSHPPTTSTGGSWTLVLDMARIKQLSIDLFGADSAYAP